MKFLKETYVACFGHSARTTFESYICLGVSDQFRIRIVQTTTPRKKDLRQPQYEASAAQSPALSCSRRAET